MFLVLVMVFVKFPHEGSGGGSDSMEDNFTLEEDVDFVRIEVCYTPWVANFSEGE